MFIYKITNNLNSKVYIGQTISSLKRRFDNHKSCKKDTALCRAFKKYGKENFSIELLATCSSLEEMNQLEVFYISKFSSMKKGYNMTSGGNARKEVSIHARNKLAKIHKGKRYSPSTEFIKGTPAPNGKAVIDLESGVVYDSVKIAAESLGMLRHTLSWRIRKSQSHKRFAFVEDFK